MWGKMSLMLPWRLTVNALGSYFKSVCATTLPVSFVICKLCFFLSVMILQSLSVPLHLIAPWPAFTALTFSFPYSPTTSFFYPLFQGLSACFSTDLSILAKGTDYCVWPTSLLTVRHLNQSLSKDYHKTSYCI